MNNVNGGLYGPRRIINGSYSLPGVWSLDEQNYWVKTGVWASGYHEDTVSDLLLYFDEPAGSTSVLDRSFNPHAMTRAIGGEHSSAQKIQGPSSWYVNAVNAKLRGSRTLTVAGDFMWQCWWYPEFYQNGYKTLFGLEGPSASWQLFINDDGSRPLFFLKHRPGFAMYLSVGSPAIPTFQWNHVALTRKGPTLTLWFNGALRASATFTETMIGVPVVNEWFTGTGYIGYIDLVQMVNGVFVYDAPFTPSTKPYGAP